MPGKRPDTSPTVQLILTVTLAAWAGALPDTSHHEVAASASRIPSDRRLMSVLPVLKQFGSNKRDSVTGPSTSPRKPAKHRTIHAGVDDDSHPT